MKRTALTLVCIGSFVAMAAGCWSPKVEVPKEEDPFAGAKIDPNAKADPENIPPPPKERTKPDMALVKDMARRSAEQAAECDMPDNAGPRGEAVVDVTFKPNGKSADILVHPPHKGTAIGDCIEKAFEGVYVTSWKGSPVRIQQKVEFKKKSK